MRGGLSAAGHEKAAAIQPPLIRPRFARPPSPDGEGFLFLLLLLRLGYGHAAVLHGRRKDDLRPGAAKLLQVVDELIQLLRRTEQHLYQHTVIAGDAVAFHHMGQLWI